MDITTAPTSKVEAIALLGGAPAAAKEIGCSLQAVHQWPDVLTDRLRDRVQAALYRMAQRRSTEETSNT